MMIGVPTVLSLSMMTNFPGKYAKVTFNENAVFNEWIGRFVCLCKLMGETPSDFIMRGINVE